MMSRIGVNKISIPYIKYVTICSNLQHLTSKFLSTIQDFDPRFDCQVFCPRLFDWLKLERSTYFHVLGHLSGESSEAQSVLTSGLPSQEPWSIVTCMFEELKNYVPNCLVPNLISYLITEHKTIKYLRPNSVLPPSII